MLKQYFLITKLNLMKKTVLRINFLLCFVVFFFTGMVTINAQYVSNDEAVVILKAEVTDLEAQIPNASGQELVDLKFKRNYFHLIGLDIADGAEVGAAIVDNRPVGKVKLYPNGLITGANDNPNLKLEIDDVVNYVDTLLSD